jgi:hypothetical protein
VSVKKASIYKLRSRFIVCPVNTTTSGIGITSEPYIVLPETVSAFDLGEAINRVLDSSHDGVSQPSDWRELAAPRLAAAGVKSESAFQKQTLLVSLIANGKTVSFTPQRNGGATGPDKGFAPIDECAVRIDAKTQEVLGETAFNVFGHCT